jgi:cell wall-associated NlpC family hydrolase
VAAVGAGMILMYAAIANTSVSDTIRALLKGQPLPKGTVSSLQSLRDNVKQGLSEAVASQGIGAAPNQITGAPGYAAGLGDKIAADAQQYIGKPYLWAAEGPNAFDCSGLVTWVLHHDLGLKLPDNTHTVTGQFYVWSGAKTVGRPPAAGDLICYTSHIGIAINATQMVHAPSPGQDVKISKIWWTPTPLVRRVIPQ